MRCHKPRGWNLCLIRGLEHGVGWGDHAIVSIMGFCAAIARQQEQMATVLCAVCGAGGQRVVRPRVTVMMWGTRLCMGMWMCDWKNTGNACGGPAHFGVSFGVRGWPQ